SIVGAGGGALRVPRVLALGLVGLVMPDRAAGGSAEDAVTARIVADDAAHHGPFEASLGMGRNGGAGNRHGDRCAGYVLLHQEPPLAPDDNDRRPLACPALSSPRASDSAKTESVREPMVRDASLRDAPHHEARFVRPHPEEAREAGRLEG